MKEKQMKRREIRDDEIAKSSQSHSSERGRGIEVCQTMWEGKGNKRRENGKKGRRTCSRWEEHPE
jgi:hypothetical protein